MAKLGLKQVLGSILVWVLFAPVILATGSKDFRLAIYEGSTLGVPNFSFLVVALLLILTVLVWVFAGGAFGDDSGEGDGQ
jgi:hypothetical protein